MKLTYETIIEQNWISGKVDLIIIIYLVVECNIVVSFYVLRYWFCFVLVLSDALEVRAVVTFESDGLFGLGTHFCLFLLYSRNLCAIMRFWDNFCFDCAIYLFCLTLLLAEYFWSQCRFLCIWLVFKEVSVVEINLRHYLSFFGLFLANFLVFVM